MPRRRFSAAEREPVVKARNELHSGIVRVLKQVHPDASLLRLSSQIICDQLRDLFVRLVDQCQLILARNAKLTVDARLVQTAVRLVLVGELTKHAISEGTKAVVKSSNTAHEPPSGPAQRVSLQARAGLQFPVTRVADMMRARLGARVRIARTGSVYLAAVLEYICAEILELAGNAARDNRRRRIAPRHLYLAVVNDDELSRLFLYARTATLTRGGVLPNIFAFLLPQKPKSDDHHHSEF